MRRVRLSDNIEDMDVDAARRELVGREFYTTGQVAVILGVSTRTVAQWCEGGCPHYRIPTQSQRADGDRRFPRVALLAWLKLKGIPQEMYWPLEGRINLILACTPELRQYIDEVTEKVLRECVTVNVVTDASDAMVIVQRGQVGVAVYDSAVGHIACHLLDAAMPAARPRYVINYGCLDESVWHTVKAVRLNWPDDKLLLAEILMRGGECTAS